jgi:hypothetical protein
VHRLGQSTNLMPGCPAASVAGRRKTSPPAAWRAHASWGPAHKPAGEALMRRGATALAAVRAREHTQKRRATHSHRTGRFRDVVVAMSGGRAPGTRPVPPPLAGGTGDRTRRGAVPGPLRRSSAPPTRHAAPAAPPAASAADVSDSSRVCTRCPGATPWQPGVDNPAVWLRIRRTSTPSVSNGEAGSCQPVRG